MIILKGERGVGEAMTGEDCYLLPFVDRNLHEDYRGSKMRYRLAG